LYRASMGAVHGVHLKYAAMSAACTTGAWYTSDDAKLETSPPQPTWLPPSLVPSLFLYGALVHLLITICFVTRRGMWLIGKSPSTGQVPLWSFVVWSAFHLPTYIYTAVHTAIGKSTGVPVASEVVPGWWLGGRRVCTC
jgi:hypothetical protein